MQSQNQWTDYIADEIPLAFSLPSNDVLYSSNNNEYLSETYSNREEDFEFTIIYFDGDAYDEYLNFDEELRAIADDYEYSSYSVFHEELIKTGVNSKYAIAYDNDYQAMVIYGLIHDTNSKVIYDIEIICFEMNVFDAAIIINSIELR